MHGSRWRREETRPVGPARAAQPRRLSPTLLSRVMPSVWLCGVEACTYRVVPAQSKIDDHRTRQNYRASGSVISSWNGWQPAVGRS